MQGFALNNISDCYVGSNQVSAIYLGNVKIWPTHDYSLDYLTFEALEPTTFSFSTNNLQYSLDNGSTWATLTAGNSTPQLSIGDKILWKQTGLTPSSLPSNYGIGTFSATGNFKVYGNIMSLYYGDNFIGQTSLYGKDYAFHGLFTGNTHLFDASNLILPTNTLAQGCYANMFIGCTSLITAPKILPATTLTDNCYQQMFQNCTSLKTAPKLPATTLASQCYEAMFSYCSSLTTATVLPAMTLSDYCYFEMFQDCTSLNYIKCLATDISAYYCTDFWVSNVAASGTFVKATNADWSTKTGIDGIPSGWTIINA